MFVMSMKTTRLRVWLTLAAAMFLVISMLAFSGREEATATGATVKAADDAARRAVLTSLGYETTQEDCRVREIQLPTESDEAFAAYNLLQLETGYDLSPYRGRRVKCWTYTVSNYPKEEAVTATLYTYRDTIIGGDISSAVQGGFSHGLKPLG